MVKKEREEIGWRIIAFIVSGTILSIWKGFIAIITLYHFVYVLITDKKDKKISEIAQVWNQELYRFVQYVTLASDERSFPFNEIKTKK